MRLTDTQASLYKEVTGHDAPERQPLNYTIYAKENFNPLIRLAEVSGWALALVVIEHHLKVCPAGRVRVVDNATDAEAYYVLRNGELIKED